MGPLPFLLGAVIDFVVCQTFGTETGIASVGRTVGNPDFTDMSP